MSPFYKPLPRAPPRPMVAAERDRAAVAAPPAASPAAAALLPAPARSSLPSWSLDENSSPSIPPSLPSRCLERRAAPPSVTLWCLQGSQTPERPPPGRESGGPKGLWGVCGVPEDEVGQPSCEGVSLGTREEHPGLAGGKRSEGSAPGWETARGAPACPWGSWSGTKGTRGLRWMLCLWAWLFPILGIRKKQKAPSASLRQPQDRVPPLRPSGKSKRLLLHGRTGRREALPRVVPFWRCWLSCGALIYWWGSFGVPKYWAAAAVLPPPATWLCTLLSLPVLKTMKKRE